MFLCQSLPRSKLLKVTKLLSGIAETQLQALWAPNSELCLLCQCPLKDLGWGVGWGTAQNCFRESGSALPGVSRGSASSQTCFLNLPPDQDAVGVQLEPERLVKILEVLRELPVPNYRCVGFPCSQSPNHPKQPWGLDLSLLFWLPHLYPTPALGVSCLAPGP